MTHRMTQALAAIACAIAIFLSGAAADAARLGPLLFSEDFELGAGGDWVLEGFWTPEFGYLAWRQDGEGIAVAGDEDWTDYVYRGAFRFDRERPGIAGVLARVEHHRPGGGRYLQVTNELDTGRVFLSLVDEQSAEILEQGRYHFVHSVWHEFELRVEDRHLQYFVDDFRVLELRNFFDPVRGKVGVRGSGGIVAFDDLSVREPGELEPAVPQRRSTPIDKPRQKDR